MAKLTLSNILSGFLDITRLNANNAATVAALENTLSRDGTSPNAMGANLDMNSYQVINLPAPSASTSATNKAYVDDAVANLTGLSSIALSTIRLWKFSTTVTMADPGTGFFRLNNATPASATSLAISALASDAGNPDYSDWIAAWDDSSNTVKGAVMLVDTSSPANFMIFNITGTVTDNTTWLQFTVASPVVVGTISNNATFNLVFVRAGDIGAANVADGDKGDIVVSASGTNWQIDAGAVGATELASDAVTTVKIQDNQVSNAKISHMAANTVKVRAASTTGNPSDLAIAASQLVGRGSSGDMAAITLGTNLSMSGTTLNAAGGGNTFLSDTYTYKYLYEYWIGKAIAGFRSSVSGTAAAATITYTSGALVDTGSTSSGAASIATSDNTPLQDVISGKLGSAEFNVVLGCPIAVSDGTNRFTARAGVSVGSFGGEQTHSIIFRHVDNVNSNFWQGVCRSGGVETVINSSVGMATAGSLQHLKWVVNAGGTSVEFFINGVSIGSITTNIPTASDMWAGFGVAKSVGSTTRTVQSTFMGGTFRRI